MHLCRARTVGGANSGRTGRCLSELASGRLRATAPRYQRYRGLARPFWLLALLLGGLLLFLSPSGTSATNHASNQVFVIELDGAITLVTERFISRAIDEAEDEGAQLVVITIDTPGGTLDATRDIVTRLLASEVPVVSYVTPDGARAASAGTFVTAAAGLAAMAPTTNIGAAAVITGEGEDLPETLGKKITEDTAALIRSIAELRGRNSEALEATVREAVAYTATEAVELGVVDLIATDLNDLLAQIDGTEISTASGSLVVTTSDLEVREFNQSLLERFLGLLADPNIAFLLLSLGSLGLIVELWSPGLGIPGALGVGFLILAYASIGTLPFSWAGVALIALAVALIVGEMYTPGGGILGTAGVIALILGGLFLFNASGGSGVYGPSVKVSLWLLGTVAAIAAVLVGWLVWEMRRSGSQVAYVSGTAAESLVGQIAIVTRQLEPSGEVLVGGEHWQADLGEDQMAGIGASVIVRSVDGLRLAVELTE